MTVETEPASETPPSTTVAPQRRTFRVAVATEQERNERFLKEAHHAGIIDLMAYRMIRLFFVQGTMSAGEVTRLGRELLADPVTETFTITTVDREASGTEVSSLFGGAYNHTIDITLLPGVTDPAAENLVRAAHLLGITSVQRAATGQRYLLSGTLSEQAVRRLATEVFSNPVIQRFTIDRAIEPPFFSYEVDDDTVDVIAVRDASDDDLVRISRERRLALNLDEMQAIRNHYLGERRDPTDVELEMLAQTWSEHCVHKTFKAKVIYTGPPAGADPNAEPVEQSIDGILRTYIRRATEKVDKPWVRSAFIDNAGIVAFDDTYDLAFKVETHNHPSALEPFGGANTGIGGVVRDVLGVSARPIANTDVLCFGPADLPASELSEGVLHPRRVADGVVHGIEDYGNKMGIPTVNGAILYHQGYTSNPLVYCGCMGILPRNSHPTAPQAGDLIVVVGGRTGRDGLRGATFSSMAMDQDTGEVAGSAVQIGHPIHEKQVLEVVLRARDERLYHAITDCGAGGLSSAVGEMGADLGARVQLKDVPLKYPGLRPWEIWLSEAQERMVLAVPASHWPRMQEICTAHDVEAVQIGEFEATGRLRLFYGDRLVGDLSMDFLHAGLPRREMRACYARTPITETPPAVPEPEVPDLRTALLQLLAHPTIGSKEDVIRRYDHEVQAGTTVKPLVGVADHGPSDAAVIVPLDTLARIGQDGGDRVSRRRGIALANGICPQFGEHDPYVMAWAAIDEALRNAVSVGADPDRVAILDNFCWGDPSLPDRLGGLVRCAQGCYDAAVAYGVPFISGKDSLNNEYTGTDRERHAIPGTLLISALGIVPDAEQTVTMDLKQAGNRLYVIGETREELLGSHYAMVHAPQASGSRLPQPVSNPQARLRALHRAIRSGHVQACHDCSEGGLAVALAEMCLAGRLGAELNLRAVPGAGDIDRDDAVLFSESLGRFIVEVPPDDADAFERTLAAIPHAHVGRVLETGHLHVSGLDGKNVLRVGVADVEAAWRGGATSSSGGQANTRTRTSEHANADSARTRSSPHHPVSFSPRLPLARRPRVVVLHASGTNRDRETALACDLAGGDAEIVHVNQLLAGERRLSDYHMLVIPGGFSYGDDLGAGTLWALDLRHRLGRDVERFVQSGRPVLGICNGFQALVKADLLPGTQWRDGGERAVTLAPNESGHFECRWVYLAPNVASACLFTQGLEELIYCPVAHSEGRIASRTPDVLSALQADGLVALTYVGADGEPAGYPTNPNGSELNIAGLCNPAGNVLGLMPHPEDHIFPWQHPRRHRGERGMLGLRLFENGIKFA